MKDNVNPFVSLWSDEVNNLLKLYPRPKQCNHPEGRFYTLADTDLKFHSVTTVLGDDPEKKKALQEWRNRVGTKEANRISSFASGRGTKVHTLFENLLSGNETPKKEILPHLIELYSNGKQELEKNLTRIYALESRLFSKRLRLAGTVDGIVEWNGVPSIIDFKTSSKLKKKEWIDDYFLQGAAYSIMLKEMTGINRFKQIVIFITGDAGIQIFQEPADPWKPKLLKRVSDFYNRRHTNCSIPEFLKETMMTSSGGNSDQNSA